MSPRPTSPLPAASTQATGPHAEAETPARTLARLRRIEGQVRGLQRMVEDARECPEVLTQIASVHEALRAVAREVLRQHLKACAADAFRSGEAAGADVCDAFVDLAYRHVR